MNLKRLHCRETVHSLRRRRGKGRRRLFQIERVQMKEGEGETKSRGVVLQRENWGWRSGQIRTCRKRNPLGRGFVFLENNWSTFTWDSSDEIGENTRTGTQGDSLPLALSRTDDSNMFVGARSPLNCKEQCVSSRPGSSGQHSLMKGQHQQDLHKIEFILMITAERSSRPPKDRWNHE